MESRTTVAARWLPTPPDVSDEPLVVVTEALLPIFDWIDVVVVRAVEQKLSAVERFLIETALALGDLDVEDVEELTGLPEEATRRIAGHLCELSVLNAEAGRYTANEDAAWATLAREGTVELRQDVLTFLVLPRSGDALAFEHKQGRGAPPQVHRLDPVASAPVPSAYRDATQVAVLRTLLGAAQVGGLPEGVTGMAEPQDDKPSPTCARRTGTPGSSACAPAGSRPRGTSTANVARNGWRSTCPGPGTSSTTGSTRPSCSTWREYSGRPAPRSAARPTTRRHGARAPRVGPSRSAPRGRGILPGGECGCAAPAVWSFSAPTARPRSRSWSASRQPIPARRSSSPSMPPRTCSRTSRRNRCTPPDLGQAIATACTAYQVEADPEMDHVVRTRLWTRGHHYPIYKLRADEDFDYE